MDVTIAKDNGWLTIRADDGRFMRYLWYPKRDALRAFRQHYGLVGKHLTIYDFT